MSAPRRRSATAPLRKAAPAVAAPPVAPLPLIDGAQPLPYDARKAVRALAKADPALGKLIERVGPVRLQLRAIDTPFEALAQAIVYQQLSGKAAATILGRVRALFPDGKLHPE